LGLASRTAAAARRRYEEGDVAALDVNVTEAAEARARSEFLARRADQEEALGDLKALLGMPAEEVLGVEGDLDVRPKEDLPGLIEKGWNRPDIRSRAAQIDQAEAEIRLAATTRRPVFDVGLRYEREEDARVALGLLAVTFPVFDRGQGILAEARARAARLEMERDALRRVVETEVRAAHASYRVRLEAASAVGSALAKLSESDLLATRSYETGEIGLLELLLVRREILDTRLAHSDRRLEAALAAVRLEAASGVLP
jgi:cobalt-zinc-cadmium efflux system outer membrane protein